MCIIYQEQVCLCLRCLLGLFHINNWGWGGEFSTAHLSNAATEGCTYAADTSLVCSHTQPIQVNKGVQQTSNDANLI